MTEHQELLLYKVLFDSPTQKRRIERAMKLIDRGLDMSGMWTRKDKMMFYTILRKLLNYDNLKEIV